MDNSIYITLSREMALFRDMDVTANNIANANTTGYNAEHTLFNSYLTKDINQRKTNPMAFAYDISTYRDTESGSLKTTGNELDVAIKGNAYFSVETPLGQRYTRAGNFQLDNEGTLITADGYAVLDSSGQHIQFPEDTVKIEIGEAGNIKVNNEEFANLGVMEFENEQLLQRLNGALFSSDDVPTQSETARVMQGTLESSNVQPITEMTHMIEISRGVGNTAKFIEVVYELQRKAANIWAQQGQG
jgi:flagellar basal-body rod protein FlgF